MIIFFICYFIVAVIAGVIAFALQTITDSEGGSQLSVNVVGKSILYGIVWLPYLIFKLAQYLTDKP